MTDMTNIYPDKKDGKLTGRWRVEVQRDGIRLPRKRFDSVEAAVKYRDDCLRQLAEGVGVPVGTKRRDTRGAAKDFRDLVKKCVEPIWAGKAVFDRAGIQLEEAAEYFGDIDLNTIDTGHIDGYIAWLYDEKNLKPATVNRYLSFVHTALKYAHKRRWIDTMPVFEWQDEPKGRLRWLEEDEERQLLYLIGNKYERPDLAAFVRLAILTGMRRGELLRVGTRDCTVSEGWLHLHRTKNGAPRDIPITEEARTIIDEYAPFGRETIWQLRYVWDKAKEDMNLADDRHFVFHACRHTTATRLVRANINLRIVQQYMGHKSIETTLRYAHVTPDMLTGAAKALGEAAQSHRDNISEENNGGD